MTRDDVVLIIPLNVARYCPNCDTIYYALDTYRDREDTHTPCCDGTSWEYVSRWLRPMRRENGNEEDPVNEAKLVGDSVAWIADLPEGTPQASDVTWHFVEQGARLRALLAAVLWAVGPRLPDSLRAAIEREGIEPKPREEEP